MALPPVIRLLRPHQWLKNVLVAVAPLAGGILFQLPTLIEVATAFIVFCLASSGGYIVNDVLDVNEDRAHEKKRFRPIASGAVKVPLAIVIAVILLCAAPLLALINGPELAGVILIYEVIQLSYCFWLKHIVVIDLVVVSSGFFLRAIAGAVAVGILASQWFLLVMAFGSLFMVAGKRYSEKLAHKEGVVTRKSLDEYSLSYLRFAWQSSAGLAMITYALWTFHFQDMIETIWLGLSNIPFGLAILRYAYNIDKGVAGAPEDTVLEDKQLLVMGAAWLVVFGVGVLLA